MKLEEGVYVRTKYGISKIVDYINDPTHYFFKCYKLDRDYINCEEYITETDILKTSHNIIDLIEVGDYVNGEKITRVIPQDICGDEVLDCQHIFVNDKEIFKHEINSIVTKELFENIKYEVE